jgi:hypothetical protein
MMLESNGYDVTDPPLTRPACTCCFWSCSDCSADRSCDKPLQRGEQSVTPVLQGCYKGVARVLQGCCKNVLEAV